MMTNKEWEALGIPIYWSIYDDTSDDNVDNWILNLSAPEGLADGIYDVQYWNRRQTGVEVKDGQFVPLPTAMTIYVLLAQYYRSVEFDHSFVEGMDWDGNCFHLGTGS